MRRATVAAAPAAVVAAMPSSALADTTWTKVSPDYNSNIMVPGLGVTGTTAAVAWNRETAPNAANLETVSFRTTPTQEVVGPTNATVASAWQQLDWIHPFLPAPGGGLQLVFDGTHTTTFGDALN